MGLRFPDEMIDKLFEGVQNMKESTTYQKILREGRHEGRVEGRVEGRQEGRHEGLHEGLNMGELREARRFLVVLGMERLGEPGPEVLKSLEAIPSVERLETLGRKMISDPSIVGWDDLLRRS